MARASKPRLPPRLSIIEAKRQAELLVTGDPDSCWVASARELVTGMLLCDPTAEIITPRRPIPGHVLTLDPLAAMEAETTPEAD